MLTLEDIRNLKLDFDFNGMTMVDWFKVTNGQGFCCISSGLRHADGETKSPYYYEDCIGGEKAEKRVLGKFNKWFGELDVCSVCDRSRAVQGLCLSCDDVESEL